MDQVLWHQRIRLTPTSSQTTSQQNLYEDGLAVAKRCKNMAPITGQIDDKHDQIHILGFFIGNVTFEHNFAFNAVFIIFSW